MNKEQILGFLKQTLPSARLPKRISLEVSGDTLYIKIGSSGVVANMQTDESAFEGWAVVLKAAIGSIQQVLLDWEAPKYDEKKESAQRVHYKRFLMRVVNFIKAYSWLQVAKEHIHEVEEIQTLLDDKVLVVNFPQKPCSPVSQEEKKPEAVLERKLVEKWSEDCPITDEQLPVGLFRESVSKDNTVTPRGASQIDLWQLDHNTLKIYELKVRGNESIGIISELLFYVYTLKNIVDGLIKYPDVSRVKNHRHFKDFSNAVTQGTIKSIIGYFTAPKFHPLIEVEPLGSRIKTILNDNTLGVKFEYLRISDIDK